MKIYSFDFIDYSKPIKGGTFKVFCRLCFLVCAYYIYDMSDAGRLVGINFLGL